MNTKDGYAKKSLTSARLLTADGGDTDNYLPLTGGTMTGALVTTALSVSGAATFSQAINGNILGNAATASRLQNARTISLTGAVTGSGSFDGSGNLSITTTAGTLTLPANKYADSTSDANRGALFLQNSNIWGVNSIYTADASGNASEGIHFYRDATHVDSIHAANGVLYFTPNREIGSAGTSVAVSLDGHTHNYLPLTGGNITSSLTVLNKRVLTLDDEEWFNVYYNNGANSSNFNITHLIFGEIRITFSDGANQKRTYISSKLNFLDGYVTFKVVNPGAGVRIGFGTMTQTDSNWGYGVFSGLRVYSSTYDITNPNSTNSYSISGSLTSDDEFAIVLKSNTVYVYKNGTFAGTCVNSSATLRNLIIDSSANSAEIVIKSFGSLPNSSLELAELTNVSISNPSNGQVLKYNGTYWINDVDATSSGGSGGITSLTSNILSGSVTSNAGKYEPFSSTTATSAWVSSNDNAGRLYLGTQNPSKTTRLNYNGYFYATKLYSGGNEVSTDSITLPSNNITLSTSDSVYITVGTTQKKIKLPTTCPWTVGSTTLSGLTDTTISSASDGQFLKYNGSAWVNSALTLAGSWADNGSQISHGVSTPTLTLSRASIRGSGTVTNLPVKMYSPADVRYVAFPVVRDEGGRLFVALPTGVGSMAVNDRWVESDAS